MSDTAAGLAPLTKLLPVTGAFAVPLVALSSLLSLNVVKTRIELNTWQGDHTISKGDSKAKTITQPDGNEYDSLLMATRVHANLIENVPITLLLAALAELNGADRKKLTTVLAAFSVLRIAHVIGLFRANQPCRAAGYFGTTGTQLGLAGWLAYLTKGYWGY